MAVAIQATYPITNFHGDTIGTTDALDVYTGTPVADEFGAAVRHPPSRLGSLGDKERFSDGTQLRLVRMGGLAARTVTFNYANPDAPTSTVSDATGTVTATRSRLGRVVSYTDVYGQDDDPEL